MTTPTTAQLQADVARVHDMLEDAAGQRPDIVLRVVAPELLRLNAYLAQLMGFDSARALSQAQKSALTQPEAVAPEALLDELLKASGENSVLHSRYQGKAMSAEVYSLFAQTRDETLPQLRKRFLALFLDRVPAGVTVPSREEVEELLARLLRLEDRRRTLDDQRIGGELPGDLQQVYDTVTSITLPSQRLAVMAALAAHQQLHGLTDASV